MLEIFENKSYNIISTPVLFVIGMPIGNMNDVSVRALSCLKESDLLICESRKVASTCYKSWGIPFPRDNHVEWNEHNDIDDIDALIDCILKTKTSALVSDAGMPILADPGSKLLEAARNSGIDVQVVPGPNAITSALTLAGLGGNGFCFVGFPPRKTPDRKKWLRELSLKPQSPIVIYETPYRLKKLLEELADSIPPKDSFVFIAIDITSEKEKIWDIPISSVKKIINQVPKGAPVLILYSKKDRQNSRL